MDSVTKENSRDYIPPINRIAVFDLDGTLFCETDPTWFDFMLYKHRILEDPTYRETATSSRAAVTLTAECSIAPITSV